MSGVLTVTYTEASGGQTTVARSQVGGTGEPDLTVALSYATVGSHQAVSRTLIGGSGHDVLVGDPITYLIDGGAGNDTITNSGHLSGQAGDDWLRGGGSDDVLTGGPGNDTIDGAAGFDLAAYGNADHGVTVDLRIAGPQETGEGADVLVGVEGLFDVGFGGVHADTFTGDAQSNWLRGGGGDDLIYGLGGDDTITDAGYDGWDGYEPEGATTRDHLRGGDGHDLLSGGADADDLNGNQGNDTVQGDAGADVLRGGQGDDSLAGGDGDDWLSGDIGNDMLAGGAGADIFRAFDGGGVERITDFNAAEGDRILMEADNFTVRQVDTDTVIEIANYDGGGSLVLVGVSMASLTGSWVFQQ